MAEEGKASLLEAIADTFEKVDKYVGIIAAIIAALTFSQGNRIVSYAFVVIGYVLIALFLWRVITQKSVVKRLIPTPRPLPEKREYSYSRSQRWIAGIALAVLTLFSSGWVGVNGWRDYQEREGLLFPRAEENELLVIIAQFDNRSTKGIDPTQRIYDRLCKELEEAGITNARLEIAPEITDLNEAREIGKLHGAIFVIWGWFDDVGFRSYFTPVGEEPFILRGMELEEVSLEPPGDFSLYIREGLPAQMAYFSTLTIGQVYYWDDKFQEALSAFSRAIENAHQSDTSEGLADVYFIRGFIHQGPLRDPKQAIPDYDKALELQPDDAEACCNRGTAYYFIGEHELAIADYDRAIQLNPALALPHNNRGVVYTGEGDWDQAIKDFDKAIQLRPDFVLAHYNRGLGYYYQGNYGQAIDDFTRAIELTPEDAEAYVGRGTAHIAKGNHDQAITDLNKAIELKPDLAEAYKNRGIAYSLNGYYEQAIADLNKAIELKPDDAEAYNNRGVAYTDKGDYDRAIADLNKAIELKSDLAEAYNSRAVAYGLKGAYDQAIADCDKAIKLKHDYAQAYANRGLAYAGKGEYDLAIADYDRAIELKPDYTPAYYSRGLARKMKGEKEEAIRDFERFLELSRDEYWRKEAEKQLRELRGQ
jgi:tetratricopeptide (TPR) repeat protein